MSRLQKSLAALAAAFIVGGCSNPCEELADRICDRASADQEGCAQHPAGSDAAKACERMEAVSLSCRVLREKVDSASDADKKACAADLELIRALERQQQ